MQANVAIPDDIVELILLPLDTLVSLVRAAATCKQWRRVVADAVFRCRYRSLHGPPVIAGTYHNNDHKSRPYFIPSQSATVDGRHISLDFLPRHMWSVKDSRGSLLLLGRLRMNETGYFSDLVVCEPLTRRYDIIPPLSTSSNYDVMEAFFLVDDSADDEGCDGMSNFRVLCVLQGHNKTHAGVFTSGRRSWMEKFLHSPSLTVGLTTRSIYFYLGEGKVMSMDLSTAEFSSFVLLPSYVENWDNHVACHRMTVITGRDSKPRFVVGDGLVFKIKVYARLQGQWVLEKRIDFSNATSGLLRYGWNLAPVASLSLYRAGSVLIEQSKTSRTTCLRLDIDTVEMEPLPDHRDIRMVYSIDIPLLPTLRACTLLTIEG
ncbi:unnamed protein product [Urochloa humidicola]